MGLPPPATPLAGATVNIHITNNHYSILTPPSTQPRRKHVQSVQHSAQSTSSPLLQRIVPYLSPIYSYLSPAATPRSVTAQPQTAGRTEDIQTEDAQTEDGETEVPQTQSVDMPFSFSAAAGARTLAVRRDQENTPPSSPPLFTLPTPGKDTADVTPSVGIAGLQTPPPSSDTALRARSIVKPKAAARRRTHARYPHRHTRIPRCYEHDLRFPNDPEGVDVVPCDWVRPFNSQRFNNYTNGDVQCAIPKCDTCITDETYGPASVWHRSAPPGHTAESHRLRSRIRYLCSRCPQPAPGPAGGIGPVELCTCVLRDASNIPTDQWFQCRECAEDTWFAHDAKYGGPDGVLVTRKRAVRRKNKLGVIVRPRRTVVGKGEGKGWRVKRCMCGRIVPRDGRYGAWCTWCQCPIDGVKGMELGGAATRSGVAFLDDPEAPRSGKEDKMDEGV